MSYSFNFATSDGKSAAKLRVAEELDKVVEAQPVHQTDRQLAEDTAANFIDLLADPQEDEVLVVNVSGYLGWRSEGVFTSGNVVVSGAVRAKP